MAPGLGTIVQVHSRNHRNGNLCRECDFRQIHRRNRLSCRIVDRMQRMPRWCNDVLYRWNISGREIENMFFHLFLSNIYLLRVCQMNYLNTLLQLFLYDFLLPSILSGTVSHIHSGSFSFPNGIWMTTSTGTDGTRNFLHRSFNHNKTIHIRKQKNKKDK